MLNTLQIHTSTFAQYCHKLGDIRVPLSTRNQRSSFYKRSCLRGEAELHVIPATSTAAAISLRVLTESPFCRSHTTTWAWSKNSSRNLNIACNLTGKASRWVACVACVGYLRICLPHQVTIMTQIQCTLLTHRIVRPICARPGRHCRYCPHCVAIAEVAPAPIRIEYSRLH